ncbi:hypothetical protein SDJN02_09191, partial [Cucurbita argyrosperma subsp. argyrosperma]
MSKQNNLESLGDVPGLSQFSNSDNFLRDFEEHQHKNRSPLSLWLNQASVDNAINNNNNISHFFGASSSSSNLFGSMTESGLSVLPLIEKEDVDNKGNLSKATAAAALLGQSSQSFVSSSPMSATALLQKAALMGSTRSSNNNNSPLFGAGAFGVMSSSSSSLNSFNKSRSPTMADSVQMRSNEGFPRCRRRRTASATVPPAGACKIRRHKLNNGTKPIQPLKPHQIQSKLKCKAAETVRR